MSRSRYTLLIDSLIDFKKIRDHFRVYLERVHPAFLTTLVVLVSYQSIYFNIYGCPFVRVYVTLFITKIVAKEGLSNLCEAQPKEKGAFCATYA